MALRKHRRTLAKWLGILLLAALVLAVAAFVYLHRGFEPGGGPPAGYRNRNEILAALAIRALPMIDRTPPLPGNVIEKAGVVYGQGGGRDLLLDLYQPKETPSRPVPGLIFIHGGAWAKGKRDDYRVYTTHFAAMGYVTTSISYRLVREAPFPAAVEDAKCAVRWMRAHAEELGVDPARIAVIGGSAGGHLAMMVGYSPGELEGSGGFPAVSSAVAAVVDIYGPADLSTEQAKSAESAIAFLGGSPFDEAPGRWLSASPVSYLDANDPTTLIMHGTLDELVDVAQADDLAERLRNLGVHCEYEKLEGWPHTMDASAPMNAYFKERLAKFFVEQLGKR